MGRILLIITLLACAFVSMTPAGYNPFSSYPAMGYGTTVISPTNGGAAFGVPSGYQYIQYSSWVRDYDQYQQAGATEIVEMKNASTDIVANIQSGTTIGSNVSYNDETNTRTIVFIVQANTVTTGSILFRDSFTAVDTGTNMTVKDANGDRQDFFVTVAAPGNNGGGEG